jgi:hypothetical protein
LGGLDHCQLGELLVFLAGVRQGQFGRDSARYLAFPYLLWGFFGVGLSGPDVAGVQVGGGDVLGGGEDVHGLPFAQAFLVLFFLDVGVGQVKVGAGFPRTAQAGAGVDEPRVESLDGAAQLGGDASGEGGAFVLAGGRLGLLGFGL